MRPRCVRPASALLLLAFLVVAPACAHGGSAGAEARQATIETNLAELQDCWDELAADHPGAAGSLLFAVELRRNGSVEWVDIEVDELGVPKLSACAVRRIKRWRFPEGSRQSIRFGIGFAG
ncbi:MAG: AgmX/PglI C-terminal domain-containing protein [Myxococcales bacterium]|nr:AgmX/PglI C-terminal domain-containing protein [Myxococcales bacterium]